MIPTHRFSRRAFLGGTTTLAASTLVPGCKPRVPPDAGFPDAAPPLARPPSPIDVPSTSPIAMVTGPAPGFLGDDFTRPHDALWKLDELFQKHGGRPPVRERAGLVIVGGGMSGLATAWRLRRHKPIVLEQGARFGGNARGEAWNGITYSIGAAYLAKPAPDDKLQTEFYGPLGVDMLWRVSDEDPVVRGGKVFRGFWEGSTDPRRRQEIKKTKRHLDGVLRKAYPDIPFDPSGDLDESQLNALDKVSLFDELTEKVGARKKKTDPPELHPHVLTVLDHYGWSTFGGGIHELSAAAFLCAYVAEFDGICALPGGNAAIAHKLLEKLAAELEPTSLRASSVVVEVKNVDSEVHVTVLDPDGRLYTIAAKAVVMSCPKFVAKKILPDLPPEQKTAIERIRYRAYVVANVLVNAPCPTPALDLYLVGDDPFSKDTMGLSTRQRATDVILGHWAQGGHPSASVLTLYRPYPFEGGRQMLFAAGSFDGVKKELAAQTLEVLPLLGLTEDKIAEVRLSRFGHALNLSETGFIADGTWARARTPVGDRIIFVEQDNWPAPAIETCFLEALSAEPVVDKILAS
ncbi:MAG: FAD-dependent oxidoreductase [Deltaproteobacteria bacterium]|nr:FAD-dependent oxidoreductase [Deltaproteobacteria bacterium]